MARITREFVKLETRLLNDYRFFRMKGFEQLIYVKLLGISRSTGNKIPKDFEAIGELLRLKNEETGFYLSQIGFSKEEIGSKSDKDLFIIGVKSAVNRIKSNFPKFKENKYFYYFEDYELRLNNSAPIVRDNSCVDLELDLDEDLDEDKDSKQQASPTLKAALDKVYKDINIYALMNKLKKQLGWPVTQQFPEEVLLKVCATYEKGKVKDEWAWFTTSIKKASEEYFVEKNIKEGQEWKKEPMATSIKEILGIK